MKRKRFGAVLPLVATVAVASCWFADGKPCVDDSPCAQTERCEEGYCVVGDRADVVVTVAFDDGTVAGFVDVTVNDQTTRATAGEVPTSLRVPYGAEVSFVAHAAWGAYTDRFCDGADVDGDGGCQLRAVTDTTVRFGFVAGVVTSTHVVQQEESFGGALWHQRLTDVAVNDVGDIVAVGYATDNLNCVTPTSCPRVELRAVSGGASSTTTRYLPPFDMFVAVIPASGEPQLLVAQTAAATSTNGDEGPFVSFAPDGQHFAVAGRLAADADAPDFACADVAGEGETVYTLLFAKAPDVQCVASRLGVDGVAVSTTTRDVVLRQDDVLLAVSRYIYSYPLVRTGDGIALGAPSRLLQHTGVMARSADDLWTARLDDQQPQFLFIDRFASDTQSALPAEYSVSIDGIAPLQWVRSLVVDADKGHAFIAVDGVSAANADVGVVADVDVDSGDVVRTGVFSVRLPEPPCDAAVPSASVSGLALDDMTGDVLALVSVQTSSVCQLDEAIVTLDGVDTAIVTGVALVQLAAASDAFHVVRTVGVVADTHTPASLATEGAHIAVAGSFATCVNGIQDAGGSCDARPDDATAVTSRGGDDGFLLQVVAP